MNNTYQLNIRKLLTLTLHRPSSSEVVYGKTRNSWRATLDRAKRLASGLEAMGVGKGSRVAVVDFDTNRYLECYYAIPMMGAVLHTVNIRLPPDQIGYTISHAQDDFIIIRDEFLPLAAKLAQHATSVKGLVTMSDTGSIPQVPLPNTHYYEDVISSGSSSYEFPDVDENSMATLFYSSGTTGLPKGVWFTHRQLVLHTLGAALALSAFSGQFRLDSNDVAMPLVPFFHVHCWGWPYSAGLLGQKLVLAGKYEAGKILELVKNEGVTVSNMVPTVLNMVVNHPSAENYTDALSKWKVIVGGSALPHEVATRARKLGIHIMTGYGLSESAPVLTLSLPTETERELTEDETLESIGLKAGLPVPLVELRTVTSQLADVPRDGKTPGEVVVRAPWLTDEYYKDPSGTQLLWSGGWMHTGDLAVMDKDGRIAIVDRIKDTVKSGGEWIPTILLEDLLMRHPAVYEAAVVRAQHPKWEERPVAVVSMRQGKSVKEEELRAHLETYVTEGVISKFWIPDRFVIGSEQLPKTSTGKIDKKPLREKYGAILMQ
jgi:fatty-acyl-CoA synthase